MSTYAQWDYLNVILEVVQQTVVFPLFWWFGKIVVTRKTDLDKIRESYILIFAIYAVLILVISFFTGDIVNALGSDEGYKQKQFFMLQLWSKVPAILTSVSIVALLNLKSYKSFFFLLIAKLCLLILFDFTLANSKVFNNPYIGLGLSQFVSEAIVCGVSIILVAKPFGFKKFFSFFNFHWNFRSWNINKKFWSNILAAFVYSAVNNGFYLAMMARNMNVASGTDAYWLSNTVIWSWVLLLSNSVFEINKSLVSTTSNMDYKKRTFLVIELQLIELLSIAISFAIFIPAYKAFSLFLAGGDKDLSRRSWDIFSKLIGFFVFYVLAAGIDAHFNGEGKNWSLAIQAIIENALTFIPFIILHAIGKLDYTVEVLTMMFGISLMVSWIISEVFIVAYLVEKKNNSIKNIKQ